MRERQRNWKVSGVGLIELLTVLFISSIVMAGIVAMFTQMSRGTTQLKIQMTRSQLIESTRRAVTSPRILKYSSTHASNSSTQINQCINGGGCTDTDAGPTWVYFSIFDQGGAKLSGTAANPARFTDEGQPCTTPDGKCVFEVITRFAADCGPVASPCAAARDVLVNYLIRNAKDGAGNDIMSISNYLVRDATGTATTAIQTINSTLAANYIPKWAGGNEFVPSLIFEESGKIGINTTTPGATLDIRGDMRFEIGGVKFKTQVVNVGVKSSSPGPCGYCSDHARAGGDTCDGNMSALYNCSPALPAVYTCSDVSGCGSSGCRTNITCNHGVLFVEE